MPHQTHPTEISNTSGTTETIPPTDTGSETVYVLPGLTFKDVRELCTRVMDEDAFIPIKINEDGSKEFDPDGKAVRDAAKEDGLTQFVAGVNDYFKSTDLTLEDIDALKVPMGLWVENQGEYTTSLRITPGDQSEFYQGWHWAVDEPEQLPVIACSIHGIDGVFFSTYTSAAYDASEDYEPGFSSEYAELGKVHYLSSQSGYLWYDCDSSEYVCLGAEDRLQTHGEEFYDLTDRILSDGQPFDYFPLDSNKSR